MNCMCPLFVVFVFGNPKIIVFGEYDNCAIFLYKHSKKNESCVTQANTVYLAEAKFILTRNGHSQINTVYCV